MTWFDRSGKQGMAVGHAGPPMSSEFAGSSAHGGCRSRSAGFDVWIYDVSRGLRTRLTSKGERSHPVWSPDGASIVFASNRKGKFDFYRKAVDSVSEEELLYASDMDKTPTSWSADGKWRMTPSIPARRRATYGSCR